MTAATNRSDLYAEVIGYGGADYYLKWFAIFDERGSRFYPSWNWAAAVLGPFWAVYRRGHNFFWLYVAATFLALPAVRLSVEFYLLLIGFAWIALAVYANAFYYRYVKNKIAEAQRRFVDSDKMSQFLERKGGVSVVEPLVLIIFSGMAGMMFIATSVKDDLHVEFVVSSASEEVMKRVLPHGRAKQNAGPAREPSAGASQRSEDYPNGVKSVTVEEGLVVTITFSGIASSCRRCAVLENVSLTLVPDEDGGGSGWRCRSRDLPAQYFPDRCVAFEHAE